MRVGVLFGAVILPAVAFALAYPLVVTQFSRGLISPYPKADVRARLFAATIDGFLTLLSTLPYRRSGYVLYLVAGAGYLLFRDAFSGQSVGKLFFGLVVISLETGRPSAFAGSVRRNLLLLLPGAHVVAVFLEAGTLVRDPQGQRLGDRLAQTQVVAGLGARDLVKSFQDWLMGLGTSVGRTAGRRRRPVRS